MPNLEPVFSPWMVFEGSFVWENYESHSAARVARRHFLWRGLSLSVRSGRLLIRRVWPEEPDHVAAPLQVHVQRRTVPLDSTDGVLTQTYGMFWRGT